MKIGIITYNRPHLKTQQILKGLIKKKYKITLLISDYKKYKKRKIFFNHRPKQFIGESPLQLSKKYKLQIIKLKNKKSFINLDFAIVGGSNVLEKKFIKKFFIINCHSGLIPQSRGLDAIKWSIYKNNKVGNTLHFIDQRIDKGKIIRQKLTKIYKSDNLKFFCKRHYQNEIDMLINFEKYIKKKENKLKLSQQKPNQRMSHKIDKELITKFNLYKKSYLKHV
jgi:phosphoribosylglycinamide formyltransferase-1